MISDAAIIYQLEKVDQGGEIQDLFEDRIDWLANELGLEVCEDDECPEAGGMILPDGRHAYLMFEAYITTAPPKGNKPHGKADEADEG